MTDTVHFDPIAARPAPRRKGGLARWARHNLFGSMASTLATLAIGAVLSVIAVLAFRWGVLHAVFAPDAEACQAARGTGACWGVIREKGRFILLGRYPPAEHWRAILATALLLSLVLVSCSRSFWKPWLGALWAGGLAVYGVLMYGGIQLGSFSLPRVTTDLWGGLPLTVLLTVVSMLIAFPIAVAVALGKRSSMPAIRTLCTLYVELVRGVPLVSVLFMASFMFPLFMPVGTTPDVLVRVIAGISLFAAAYMAEVIRGGLQTVGRGQLEAAASIGLGAWQTQRKVVLPQALAAVVPALMNNLIGLFKDTSLVTIVSLYELTGALSLALGSDPNWRPFKIEGYLFIAAVYFAFCLALSRYSLALERRISRNRAH